MLIYKNGKSETAEDDWLDKHIDPAKAALIKSGELPDCALPDLGIDEKGRQVLADFASMWDGLLPPHMPSAREYLTDNSSPGGAQPKGGIGALVDKLIEEIGKKILSLIHLSLILNPALTASALRARGRFTKLSLPFSPALLACCKAA